QQAQRANQSQKLFHRGTPFYLERLLPPVPMGMWDDDTNSILKHGIEHSRFFVPAKLSEARRTGGTRERNEAKPGRKRCCANAMF
ncbi:hypothetical protein M2T53_28115, partial [Klebsiella pneumoniae]|nr:hypothetical protein [Klebsiella pneumoniae]